MSKAGDIMEYLMAPMEIGETILIKGKGNGSRNVNFWGSAVVKKIDYKNGGITVLPEGCKETVIKHKYDCKRDARHIGYNPFPKKPWNSSLKVVNYCLSSILHAIGYERSNDYKIESVILGDYKVPELNWNPFVGDADDLDNRIHYQRDLVWSLSDKQKLITSVYNGVNIGSIVIRSRSWDWVDKVVKLGIKVGFKDVVDGKQRLNALLSFIHDEFVDENGYLYSELSGVAQRKFRDFSAVSYGELGENTTDQDVLDVFLGVNFTGVAMDQKHIEFVKNIKL